MKSFLPLAAAGAVACVLTATASSATAPVVSRNGLGDIRIGMDVTQASRNSGLTFRASDGPDITCRYAVATNRKLGLALMVARRDRIVRIDLTKPPLLTAKGIHVGSTQKAVLAAYPTAISVPHKYRPAGKEIWVGARPTARSGRAMVFETNGKRVTLIRAGKLPQVGYVEGCS